MTLSKAILSIFARWPFLMVAGALGIVVGVYFDGASVEKFQVRAEILIVPSYEYTAPNVRRSSPSQMTRVDLDVLVNNEIQIMSSIPAITEAARTAPPSPRSGAVPTSSELQHMVDIRLVENTSVIDLQIIDPDPDWAIAFATALIDAYENARGKVFSDPGAESGVAAMIEATSSEIARMSDDLAGVQGQFFSYVASFQAGPESTAASGSVPVSFTGDQLRLGALAVRLEEILALPAGWQGLNSSTVETGQISSRQSILLGNSTPEEVAAQIASMSALIESHDALSEGLSSKKQTLRELQEIQLQNSLRLASNSGVHVLSPPIASKRPVGLSNLEAYVSMALLGMLAGALLLLVFEAYRGPNEAH
jgi:hypothetical protein